MQTQPVGATSFPDAVMDEAEIADYDRQDRDEVAKPRKPGEEKRHPGRAKSGKAAEVDAAKASTTTGSQKTK
jgi:hypothetical protein